MKSVGVLATAVTVALAAGAVVIGVRSIPDIKRYMKMRSM